MGMEGEKASPQGWMQIDQKGRERKTQRRGNSAKKKCTVRRRPFEEAKEIIYE